MIVRKAGNNILLLLVVILAACAAPRDGFDENGPAFEEILPTGTLPQEPDTPIAVPADPAETETAVPTNTSAPAVEAAVTQQAESGEANADVLYVVARQDSEDSWRFTVTVEHPDTGWEDYADGWDVVLPDGSVAKSDPDSPFTRLLLHPHETEQPFTRSQSGVPIAPEITEVTVRAHDLLDGFGGREVILDLQSDGGEGYEVERLH